MKFFVFLWRLVTEWTTWLTGGIFLAYIALATAKVAPAIPEAYEMVVMRWYVLCALLFSCYRIWSREYRNPVDHRVTSEVRKINFDYIGESYEISDEDIAQAETALKQWGEWLEKYSPEQMLKFVQIAPSEDQCRDYLNSVPMHKKKLTEFREKVRNCYFFDCYIHNHGSLMDSKITINISASSKSEGKFRFYKHINELCSPPEKPMLYKGFETAEHIKDIVWGTYDGEPPKEKWLSHSVHPGHIYIEIDELKVGTGFHFIYHDAILQTEEKEIQLDYWISSANTTKRIDGKLVINLENAKNKWPLIQNAV